MGATLLDHRYLVSSLLSATAHSRRFSGCHVELDTPVRIVELRPPDRPPAAREWDPAQCASLAARAAALRHPVLPRVRDCFYAGGVCYVVEDAADGERLAGRLACGDRPDLRAALRDGLVLCDAVARVAVAVPELLACLLIAGTTLAYDASGAPHLTTWDYARWLGGRGALDPGVPDLRAPELRDDARLVPDERAHVYSIAALLSLLLTGSTELPAASPVALPGSDLPGVLRTALEPALRADPRRRTPTADALGRALARAARETLPALEPTPISAVASPPPATAKPPQRPAATAAPAPAQRPRPRPRPRPRTIHQQASWAAELARRTAPRALRLARERSRAAVEAALHHRAGRTPGEPRSA